MHIKWLHEFKRCLKINKPVPMCTAHTHTRIQYTLPHPSYKCPSLADFYSAFPWHWIHTYACYINTTYIHAVATNSWIRLITSNGNKTHKNRLNCYSERMPLWQKVDILVGWLAGWLVGLTGERGRANEWALEYRLEVYKSLRESAFVCASPHSFLWLAC